MQKLQQADQSRQSVGRKAMKTHGTRAEYLRGCRCLPCRVASAAYQAEYKARLKRGETILVSASRSRNHLLWLSGKGTGRHAVAMMTGISERTLFFVRNGRRSVVRRETESKILAVRSKPVTQYTLVPFGPTGELIEILCDEGFTRKELARRLGYKSTLQLGYRPTIRKGNAQRVRAFYDVIMAGAEEDAA